MKKNLMLHRVFLFLKFLTLTIAGGLNVWGIYRMSEGYVHWDDYILYSIYFLGGTIVTSIIANVFNQKIFKTSFNAFLEQQDLNGVQIIRKTEKSLLVSIEEVLHTVYIERLKDGVGFVLVPAELSMEGTVIRWDETLSEKEVQYVSGWKNPVWKDKEPVDECEESTALEIETQPES